MNREELGTTLKARRPNWGLIISLHTLGKIIELSLSYGMDYVDLDTGSKVEHKDELEKQLIFQQYGTYIIIDDYYESYMSIMEHQLMGQK